MIRLLLKPSAFLLLALACTLSLSACDSGGSNEEDEDEVPEVEEGRVNVSIDGDASGSFEGYAYFVEETDSTGRTMFGIMLSETNTIPEEEGAFANNGEFIVIARESGRPSVGQHTFTPFDIESDDELSSEDFIAVAWSFMGDSDSSNINFYISNGGTLTITTSTDSRVAGSFEMNAVGYTVSSSGQGFGDQEEANITIEGAFDAQSADTLYDFWAN